MRIRLLILRAIGGAALLDAAEFYAEQTTAAMRGTVGRWAPGVHPAPQPRRALHGEPSMWDRGELARWALDEFRGRR